MGPAAAPAARSPQPLATPHAAGGDGCTLPNPGPGPWPLSQAVSFLMHACMHVCVAAQISKVLVNLHNLAELQESNFAEALEYRCARMRTHACVYMCWQGMDGWGYGAGMVGAQSSGHMSEHACFVRHTARVSGGCVEVGGSCRPASCGCPWP